MLVNEYINPQLQCVDIETDFNQFYLKFVKKSDSYLTKVDEKKLEFEIRQVRHFWRNRISFNTSKVKKNEEKWGYVKHHRIANYFKLYTQVLNFSMYMCVSHRNMISVYDMTNSDENAGWIDTIEFTSGLIRQMFIKKRSKAERS